MDHKHTMCSSYHEPEQDSGISDLKVCLALGQPISYGMIDIIYVIIINGYILSLRFELIDG